METARNYPLSSLQVNSNQFQQFQPLYAGELPEQEEDELNLGQIWGIISRRAVLIAGIATTVTAAVLFSNVNQTPTYKGKFEILVEPVSGQGASGLSSLAQNLGLGSVGGSGSLDYDSQLEVLRSRKVMTPIIQQLQARYGDIDYEALFGGKGKTPTLEINQLKKTKIIQVSYTDKDPEKVQFVLEQVAKGYLDYSLNQRQTKNRQAIQFIDKQIPQFRQRVDDLQKQLQQFRQQYKLIDPAVQGQQLALQYSSLENQELEFQTQLNQQKVLLLNLQNQLGINPNVALAASVLTQAPRYQLLLNQLRDVETRIALEQVRFTENSPNLQILIEQRNRIIPLIREEAQRVLGSNLGGIDPRSFPFQDSIRFNTLQQLIQTQNTIDLAEIRMAAVQIAKNRINQQVEEFPRIVREFTDLQRDLGVATNTFNQLLAQREALRVEAAKEDIPWELMEDIKTPKIPRDEDGKLIKASPKLFINVIMGAMLGLMLGLGAAILAERLNNVFHSSDDVKDASRWPLLGVIPLSDRALQLPASLPIVDSRGTFDVQHLAASPFSEAFRSLNANLRLLSGGNPIRSLTISSAAPGDGKSTIAVNLALAAAAMGQRVLLVDADLRWPQVHAKFGLPLAPGLTELITTNQTPSEVIQRSRFEENLYVLSAGSITSDPLRILSSKKMQALMAQWQTEFDLIIYDTPPLLGLADASLLATNTNGILLVVGIGQTERSEFQQALEGLQSAGTPILGIVANRAPDYTINGYYRRYPMAPPQNYETNAVKS